jgi:hypothetical protein
MVPTARTTTRTSARAARSARHALIAVTPTVAPALERAAAGGDEEQRATPHPLVPPKPAAAPRGQHTAAFEEWVQKPSPQKPTHTSVLTKQSKQKDTRSDNTRAVRRGELEGVSTKYQGISDFDEFYKLCSQIDNGELKWAELKELRARGKISTSEGTITRYTKGAPTKDKLGWAVEPRAYLKMTAEARPEMKLIDKTMLLGAEAEELMVHVIVRCSRRKKGLTERDIKMWARAQVPRTHRTVAHTRRRQPARASDACANP